MGDELNWHCFGYVLVGTGRPEQSRLCWNIPPTHTYTSPCVQVVSLSDYVKELVSEFLYDRVVGAQWAERVQFKVWSMVFVDVS